MSKCRKIMLAIAFIAIAMYGFVYAQKADAAPWDYCKIQGGYIPPYWSVCNGVNQSCYLAFNNCTTIPDKPGTWNPRGYTPCQERLGCN